MGRSSDAALRHELQMEHAVEKAMSLLTAAKRLLPSPEMRAAGQAAPDDEPINLVTTWGAVRHLAAIVASVEAV